MLEILKIYIKTNFVNGFILLLKLSANTHIFFVKKSKNSFCLCIKYQGLNN